ncbi:MAG TPA: D-2-hydroxyacid dehydrogenase family protein [Nakamurella sp.]
MHPDHRTPCRVAVLDDYQGVALASADWASLGSDVAVQAFSDHLADRDRLVERLAGFAVVVAMRERTPFPRDLLARLPDLQLLVTTGMKNASIDVPAAGELGITVCGTPLAGGSTVELTWALIMAVTRDIPGEDSRTRAGRWQQYLPVDLAGSTLGVVGLGRLGRRVSAIANAFGMNVLAWSRHLTAAAAADHGAEYAGLQELFERSDIVTVHVPLSDSSRGLVGAGELRLLGPDGFLVNTSRGPVVDQAALVDALRAGTIAGAALDVFDVEPLPADHPLCHTPRTVLSPHVGFVSKNNYQLAYGGAVEDVRAWQDGSPIRVLS